jgi:hypothetical protein
MSMPGARNTRANTGMAGNMGMPVARTGITTMGTATATGTGIIMAMRMSPR